MKSAPQFLIEAVHLLEKRAVERDTASERSMIRCVESFNAMTGHNLTEEDGWQFMVFLKFSRMRGGCYKMDDYEDAVAYCALQAETAASDFEQSKHDPFEVIEAYERQSALSDSEIDEILYVAEDDLDPSMDPRGER